MDTISDAARDAYRACVLRDEDSLNDILISFNKALEAAGLSARYIQLGEDEASWQANTEKEVETARKFHSEMAQCLSSQELEHLIRTYRREGA